MIAVSSSSLISLGGEKGQLGKYDSWDTELDLGLTSSQKVLVPLVVQLFISRCWRCNLWPCSCQPVCQDRATLPVGDLLDYQIVDGPTYQFLFVVLTCTRFAVDKS